MSPPRGAHLVGSIPLGDAEEVFRAAAGELGRHLRRIPDGETGERRNWIRFQAHLLAAHPDFEHVEDSRHGPLPAYRVRPGVDPHQLRFPDLGYAEVARRSYNVFRRLQAEAVVPESARFQVSLPTPAATISAYVAQCDRAAVELPYQAALLRELKEICEAVPSSHLAIQWDVCMEVGMWEQLGPPYEPWFDDVRAGSLDRIGRLAGQVPDGVELGFHLCYGDYEREHFKQPEDTAILVEMANGIVERCQRPIAWFHLPVPRDRSDAAYFEPLQDLELPPDTRLYLGLVHMTDGAEGTQRRIATALQFAPDFGVATECGFGRRPREQVGPLLRMHARVAQPDAAYQDTSTRPSTTFTS
jgi:hypothetical protein